MKLSIRSIAVVAAFLMVGRPASGQQQARPTPAEELLRKPLSATIPPCSLSTALKQLSALSGIELKASPEVADLRVYMFVHDLPLATVQDRLAEVLHLSWERIEPPGESPPKFRIYRSARNRADEEELITRGEHAFRAGIEEAIRVMSLPSNERNKLIEENPSLAETFRQAGAETAVGILSRMSPEQRQQLYDGGRADFALTDSSGPYHEAASAVLKDIKDAGSANGITSLLSEKARVTIGRNNDGAQSLVGIGFSERSDTVVAETGVGIRGTNTGMVYPEMYHKDHSAPEYAAAHATVTVRTECWGNSFEEVLGKLSDSLKINFVGESYRRWYGGAMTGLPTYPCGVPKGPTTVERALDAIVIENVWWKRGPVYMVQHPLWWIDRKDEVSDRVVERLKDLLHQDELRIDDWGEMGRLLSKRQWPILNMLAGDRDFLFAMEHHWMLRFYGNLSRLQASALFNPSGVDASKLSSDDRERLRDWLREAGVLASHRELEASSAPLQVVAVKPKTSERNQPIVFRVLQCAQDGSTQLLHQELAPAAPMKRQTPGSRAAFGKRSGR